jgi:hypothetical protein
VKKHLHIDEAEMGEVIDVAGYKEKLEKALEEMKRVYAEQVSLRTATGKLESDGCPFTFNLIWETAVSKKRSR